MIIRQFRDAGINWTIQAGYGIRDADHIAANIQPIKNLNLRGLDQLEDEPAKKQAQRRYVRSSRNKKNRS